MNRPRTLAPLALCLVLATGACSGGDEPEAKPTKTSATPAPTVPVQPQGEFGVTYDVQNWDEIAKDDDKLEVVAAWKKANEAAAASYNERKLLGAVRESYNRKMQRVYAKALKTGWSKKYTVRETGIVDVQSVSVDGSNATLVACNWKPSTDLYQGRKMVGGLEQSWRKHTAKLTKSSDKWTVVDVVETSDCKGLRAP